MIKKVKHHNNLQTLFQEFLEQGYDFEGAKKMVEKTIAEQNK